MSRRAKEILKRVRADLVNLSMLDARGIKANVGLLIDAVDDCAELLTAVADVHLMHEKRLAHIEAIVEQLAPAINDSRAANTNAVATQRVAQP